MIDMMMKDNPRKSATLYTPKDNTHTDTQVSPKATRTQPHRCPPRQHAHRNTGVPKDNTHTDTQTSPKATPPALDTNRLHEELHDLLPHPSDPHPKGRSKQSAYDNSTWHARNTRHINSTKTEYSPVAYIYPSSYAYSDTQVRCIQQKTVLSCCEDFFLSFFLTLMLLLLLFVCCCCLLLSFLLPLISVTVCLCRVIASY